MQPYKRKPRTGGSMVVLGGWLFADLLLGLAMLFAVATTVGAPPPTPTPTATPDELATAEANFAVQIAANDATTEALQDQIAQNASVQQTQEALIESQDAANARATEAAQIEATRAAQTDSERATADALATQDAVVAQATIEALSTEQAAAAQDQTALNDQLATTEARATEEAAAGIDTQATIDALNNQIAQNSDALATSEAQQGALQATNEAIQAEANATTVALEEQVAASSLNSQYVTLTTQVDLSGVLAGQDSAISDAEDALHDVLDPYVEAGSCHIGFALISSAAPDVPQGSQLSREIGTIMQNEFPELMPIAADGSAGELPTFPIADPGVTPTGQVELILLFNVGCQPAS